MTKQTYIHTHYGHSSSLYTCKVHLFVESITIIIVIITAYGGGHSTLEGLVVERRIVGGGAVVE